MTETKNNTKKAYKIFINNFKVKYPKVVECLEKDQDKLLTFYDFPAENWQYIRTINPIESTFATVKHRSYKAKDTILIVNSLKKDFYFTIISTFCFSVLPRHFRVLTFAQAHTIHGVRYLSKLIFKHILNQH